MDGLNALSQADLNKALLSPYYNSGETETETTIEATESVSSHTVATLYTNQIVSTTLFSGITNSSLNVISSSFLNDFLYDYYDFMAIPYSAVQAAYGTTATDTADETADAVDAAAATDTTDTTDTSDTTDTIDTEETSVDILA